MTDHCTFIGDIAVVTSRIFSSNDWIDAVNALGFELLFYGDDLKKLADSAEDSLNDDGLDRALCIALDLAQPGPKPSFLDSQRYTHGYPYLPLLLRCLKPWKWSSEGKHILYMPDCNIELNIGIYAIGAFPPGFAVGSRRLAVKRGSGPAESAVCYEGDSRDFFCFVSDKQMMYFCLEGERHFMRPFNLPLDKECKCRLEAKLRDVQPSDDTTKQKFDEIESPYSQAVFQDTQDLQMSVSGQGYAHSGTVEIIPEAMALPPELKMQILGYLDEFTYNTLAGSVPYSGIFYKSFARYAFTWKAVIRDDFSYRALMQQIEPAGDAVLAGLGVRSLYNATNKLSNVLHHVILSWTPGNKDLFLNPKKFDMFGVATLFRPSIRLHALPPGDEVGTRIIVDKLDDYIEKVNEEYTIPVLYFKDKTYSLENVRVIHNERGYSFTAKNVTITLSIKST